MFIENVGQMASEARYQVRGANGAMWLTDNAIWISLQAQSHPDGSPPVPEGDMTAANVKLTFVGAATNPQLEAFDRLDTTVNYFTGRDSSEWLTNVPAWGGVRYMNLFPGVDLELSGQDSNLAWQWICGTNCQAGMENMQLRVEGADTVQVQDGVLQLETVAGAVALPLPMLATHSLPQPVVTSQGERDFVITSPASIGLRTPAAAPGQVNLIYSGFLGGSAWDEARDIAVDSDGNAYVTGGTWSSNFPTVIGPDPTNSGFSDAFV
ncbi:MAG: SBBP repeat-containing protein, partial [Anaerolineae bacterium]|nr:SBBP repeat-containing protein [Anaerolineae bacterium]